MQGKRLCARPGVVGARSLVGVGLFIQSSTVYIGLILLYSNIDTQSYMYNRRLREAVKDFLRAD
jgi:hypothetical protein